MKAKNKLLLLAMYVAVLFGFASIDSLAATITSAASGNWNAGATWVGGVVPTNTDDVVIENGHTVVVNLDLTDANSNRSVQSLTINAGGTLRPDAGVRNIEIDNDLTVAGTGVAQYNYLTTGRLNWTFTGVTDGSGSISSAVIGNTQFNNLSFAGTGVNATSTGAAGITVYGNITVSSLSSLDMNNDAVSFANTSTQTITNNNTITWAAITLGADAVVNYEGQSGSDNNIEGNITIGTDATLTVVAPSVIDLVGGSTSILNGGDFDFNSGTELNIDHATTIASSTGDINNFNGDLTLGAATLTMGARSINGTGTITTSGLTSIISLANANGVKAALALTGTRTFNAATSFIFSGAGDTGFDYSTTGNDVTSVGDLTISGATTSADSFTFTGNFIGGSAFTASSGTITAGGTTTTISGAGAKTFNNLTVTSTATSTLGQNITVAGSLVQTGTGSFVVVANTVAMTGTGTLTLLDVDFTAPGGITVSGASSNVTLGAALDLSAGVGNGTLTMNNATATLDLAAFAIAGAATPHTILTTGTVRTSSPTGMAGNFSTGYAAGELSVGAGLNYDFYTGATSLGLTVGDVTGGNATGINQMGNLSIEGTAAITTAGQAFSVAGNITVESGASMITGFITTMNGTSLQTITNNAATSAALTFTGLTIGSGSTVAANVTTASNFTMAGALRLLGTDADVFTATAGTITFGASGDVEFTATGGILTLYNATVTANQTWADVGQSAIGDFIIGGNLLVTGGTFAVDPLQDINFVGEGKTIEVTGGTMALGDVYNDGSYTTTSIISIAGDVFQNTGSFVASSPSAITFTDNALGLANTAADSPIDSLVFYDVTLDGNANGGTEIFTVLNDIETTGAFNGTGGTIKIMGEPTEATIFAGTTWGNVNIPVDKTLDFISGTSALANTMTLDGTIEVNTAAQLAGAGIIAFGNGSNVIVDGNVAGGLVGAITASGSHTFGTGTNYVNVTFTSTFNQTALGLQTDAVLANDLARHINNLTLNHISNIATLDGPVTMYGNFSRAAGAGTVVLTDVAGNVLTLAGTGKTFTNLDAAADLSFDDVTVTGTYTETASSLGFSVGLLAGSDAIFTVSTGTWSSALATGATFISNSTNTTAIAGAGSKVFNNFTVGDAANSTTTGVDYTVNGNYVVNATAVNFDHAAGTVTLAGTSSSLTNNGATRDILTFNNLTVTGSYSTAVGVNGFEIGTNGILNVSGTGSLSVQSGSTTVPGTTEGLSFLNGGKITGSGTITLGSLVHTAGTLEILNGTTVTIDGDVAGALTNTAGALNGLGTSTLVLANGGGTNNITLTAGTITLANLEIAASAVVTNNVALTIKRDITVNTGGSFVSSAALITLDSAGASTSTITNNGTLTFYSLMIGNTTAKTVTTASDFNIGNDMQLGALCTFTATAGTITFNKAGAQQLINDNTGSGLTFNSLAKTGTGLLNTTTDNSLNIKGDITAAGTSGTISFTTLATSGKLFLNGTAEQNIIIGTTAVNAIDFGFVTLNNEYGVKISGATTEGDIQFDRTLRLQNGDIDLNGNNIIEIDETAGLLSETAGNTIINTGTAASIGYVFVNRNNDNAALTNNNMNGIGATITTAQDPVDIKVKRYHISRTVGSVDGISRVFSIVTTDVAGLDAKVVFRYDDSELNGLTAADLEIARTDDQISGPYYLESSVVNTTNKILTVDNIDGFATGSVYEYWTASVPVMVTTAEITKGLASSPLVAGRTEQGIYGLEFTSTGDVTVNSITFELDRDVTIGSEFSKYYLVSSGDNDLSTTSDNTTLLSGTNGVPATITVNSTGVTFDLSSSSQSITTAAKLNYFLVVDVATSVTTGTSSIGATFDETNLSITNGIAEAVSEEGTDYTFKPGLMIDEISNGLTQSPLIASTDDNGLFGFQIKSTSAATDGFDTLVVTTNVDVTNIFDEVRLVRSTTNDVTTGTLTTVKTGAISSTGITFANINEAMTTTAKYYFLVADVNANVDRNTSAVVFTIADADLNDDANAGPRYINALGNVSSSFSSVEYTFDKSEVTVSQTSPLVTQSINLGRGVNNQPVYRFTLTSDNGNSVAFTKVIAHATLAKGLLAANVNGWRLWSDANGNDYPDSGEQIAVGVYNANAAQGNLTFDNFTAAQTTTSSRKYIVTANIAAGATLNGELSINLLSQSYVTVTSPAKVNNFANLTGSTYVVKAPGTASTAKIVGLSTNSIVSGGSVSYTVRTFDASDVPANVTASTSVALNVNAGGFTFGGTSTGTILAGSSFVSITPTMSHATGTTIATATATLTGGLSLTTAASPTITVFKSAPTANGTVTLGASTSTTLSISSWTNGTGGTGRIVVISANTPPTPPTNGTTYTANTNIGSGAATAQTGAGSFVVATGNSAVTTVTGLTPGVTYYVQVFEYDGSGSTIVYNTTGKTSVSVDGTSGNPAFKATTAGTLGASTLATAANISTDVDVTGTITTETEATEGKWFKFKVNANRNNFYIKLSDLPANYSLYLYDYTTGSEVLFRTSETLLLENDVVIVNNATAGNYLIKIFGADNTEFDASTFGLKVVTSENEILSLTE